MAQSVEGALINLIVARDGFGVPTGPVGARVWRRSEVPEKATFPYVTMLGPLARSAPRSFGGVVGSLVGDSRTMARARIVQIDLWQRAPDEDFELVDRITDIIDGASLRASTPKALGLRVTDSHRIEDPVPDLVHDAITVIVSVLR